MQIATVNVTSTHPTNLLGLVGFLVVWIVLFECAHLLIMLLRNGPLIAWAISPLGVTVMFLREPSMPYIWLNVFFPALISGSVVYFGLFSSLAPITLPHTFLIEIPVVVIGILLS